MDTREIIRILMLSDFYFTMPVAERWGIIQRLRLKCGPKTTMATEADCGADQGSRPPEYWPAS